MEPHNYDIIYLKCCKPFKAALWMFVISNSNFHGSLGFNFRWLWTPFIAFHYYYSLFSIFIFIFLETYQIVIGIKIKSVNGQRNVCKQYFCSIHSGRRKLENFEGNGDEKFGVKGGYPLEKSSVLAHFFTAYGKFYYFSWFFFPFLDFSLLFFFLLGILGGGSSPSLKILGGGGEGDTSPRVRRLWIH